MTLEELKNARNLYKDLSLEQKKMEANKKRMKELEENVFVQEYIELQKKLQTEKYSRDNSIERAFDEFVLATKKSNEILVYLGMFTTSNTEYNYSDFIDIDGTFALYEDLETLLPYYVPADEIPKFEEEHNIIYVPRSKEDKLNPYQEEAKKLRNEFFLKLMKKSQKEAIDEIFSERGYTYKKIK